MLKASSDNERYNHEMNPILKVGQPELTLKLN